MVVLHCLSGTACCVCLPSKLERRSGARARSVRVFSRRARESVGGDAVRAQSSVLRKHEQQRRVLWAKVIRAAQHRERRSQVTMLLGRGTERDAHVRLGAAGIEFERTLKSCACTTELSHAQQRGSETDAHGGRTGRVLPQGAAVKPQRLLQRVSLKGAARQPKQRRHVFGAVVTPLGGGLEALRRLVDVVSGERQVSARKPRQLLSAVDAVGLRTLESRHAAGASRRRPARASHT